MPASLTNPWYHQMINQVMLNYDDASCDAALNAHATMMAGAFIAEAITHAFEEQRDNRSIQSAMEAMSSAVESLADAVKDLKGT